MNSETKPGHWTWRIGRFAGIDTHVHVTFLLLVGWAAWAAYAGAGTAISVVLGVGFLLAVFGSVLLHELGHALVARRYGIRTRRIILSPIGGVAQLEGMPSQPRQEMAVALAGPAVNFVLAAGLWAVGSIVAAPLVSGIIGSLMWANLMLGAFNLVPAFPMDGGRALRAFLSTRMGDHKATEIAVFVGKTTAIGMGIVGLFGNWMLVAIAVFVWFAANSELKAARMQAAYEEGGFPASVTPWLRERSRTWSNRARAQRPTWDLPGTGWQPQSNSSVRVVVVTGRY
ncbi:MAG: site-2 protease family protein [Nannocystaceae bacterium]|nr:site-2 protease family protein [Nannocystaceae bacterium]